MSTTQNYDDLRAEAERKAYEALVSTDRKNGKQRDKDDAAKKRKRNRMRPTPRATGDKVSQVEEDRPVTRRGM